jgi:hypothetical protein
MTVFTLPILLFVFLLPLIGAALVVAAVFEPTAELAADRVRNH